MFQLVLGRSGSGKSALMLERAAQSASEGNKVLLLVPEQFSFATERKMLSVLGGRSLLGVSVLSFSRLCENIFRQFGGLAGRRLSDMARLVLMKLAVCETADRLELYAKNANRTDFLQTLLQTIEELKSSGSYPTTLRQTADSLPESQLRAKLADITAVYEVYQGVVERSYQDPLDDISRAVALVRGSGFFAGYHLFVDGFGFFSPPERDLLEQLLEQCEQMTVALSADSLTPRGELDIFHDQKQAAHRLLRRCNELGIRCGTPLLLEKNQRTALPRLLAVEQFAATGCKADDTDGEGLVLLRASDKYEEVRYAAAEITRLVRHCGYRYRDIAVVMRSLADYETALEGIFHSYQIPLFFDKKEPVLARPLMAVVTAALDAVRGGWKTEAILRIARSPAAGLTMEQAAALENYLYIWSVEGGDWDKPFTGSPGGLERATAADTAFLAELEALRQRLMQPLDVLRRALRRCTGREFAAAVYRYLGDLAVVQNLRLWYADDTAALEETDTLYGQLMDILDLFADSMETTGLPAVTFIEMFSLAVGCIELGQIPNTNDQTIAGSADRVRLDSPRAVFVLGVNEGVFPASYTPYGVFSDTERELLVQHGVELSASPLQRALLERFYLYSAVAAPRERLYLCHTTTTLSGVQQEPALLAAQLWEWLPDCRTTPAALLAGDYVADLFTAREQYVRSCAGGGDALLQQALAAEGDQAFLAAMARLALSLPAEGIRPETAAAFLKGKLALSPSRIEDFFRCPYLYFCNSMLRLRPRRRVEYTPLESGSAVHFVLEKLLAQYGGAALTELSDDRLEQEVSELLRRYIESVTTDTEALRSRFKYQFSRLVSVLVLLVRHIGEDFAQSLFVTAGVEVVVGQEGDVKPIAFTLKDGTALTVSGKIDRVDLYVDGDDRYARVVDYKSGNKEFDLNEVFYGLNMQMLLYLFALCGDSDSPFGVVQPAGILYMPGKVSAVSARPDTARELLCSLLDETLQMKGLLLEHEKVLRAMERELAGRYIPAKATKSGGLSASSRVKSMAEFARIREVTLQNVVSMGEALVAGQVEPIPARSGKLNPCDYCDYGLLCANKNTPLCRAIEKVEQNDEEVSG